MCGHCLLQWQQQQQQQDEDEDENDSVDDDGKDGRRMRQLWSDL